MTLRIARHTNNLERIITFYTTVLNLEVLGSFKQHNDYDGVFIGHPELQWHLEFTSSSIVAKQQFEEDDLLVFYPESTTVYETIIKNIQTLKIPVLRAKNPYWNENGILIQDPDGHYIEISPLNVAG